MHTQKVSFSCIFLSHFRFREGDDGGTTYLYQYAITMICDTMRMKQPMRVLKVPSIASPTVLHVSVMLEASPPTRSRIVVIWQAVDRRQRRKEKEQKERKREEHEQEST